MNKTLISLALSVVLISGCTKKGDPGPAGADGAPGATGPAGPQGATGPDAFAQYINGSLSGTITGTKADGTALNETFNYTYGVGPEGYNSSNVLSLRRSLVHFGPDNMILTLIALNKGAANQQIILQNNTYANVLNFSKQISSTQLFMLEAPLTLNDYDVLYPVDPANATYPFQFNFYFYGDGGSGWSLENSYVYENNTNYVGFATKARETVYYQLPYYGGGFYKIVDAAGIVSYTSNTYGGLTLTTDSHNQFYFLNGTTDLSKLVSAKADTYSITNYTYDATTTMLSFDFKLNLGGAPFPNTTTHPLTITGKFTGKVYDKITNSTVQVKGDVEHP